jgi:putative membrane protein
MLDLAAAIAHHLLIFGLFGVLTAELVLVKQGIDLVGVRRVAAVDVWYGVLAVLILVVGFSRAVYAAKGWPYYSHNAFFWAKIATFGVIGLLSAPPTIAFARWRKSGDAPSQSQVASVRRFLWIEVALFPLLLAFAAAMARGYGVIASGP